MPALRGEAAGAGRLRLASAGSERVPLYSDGRLAAFVRRTGPVDASPPAFAAEPRLLAADRRLEQAIRRRWQDEAGTSFSPIDVSVSEGIVSLSGCVGSVHDKRAVQRIAAAMDGTLAIIDALSVADG